MAPNPRLTQAAEAGHLRPHSHVAFEHDVSIAGSVVTREPGVAQVVPRRGRGDGHPLVPGGPSWQHHSERTEPSALAQGHDARARASSLGGAEADAIGWGGIAVVARVTGLVIHLARGGGHGSARREPTIREMRGTDSAGWDCTLRGVRGHPSRGARPAGRQRRVRPEQGLSRLLGYRCANSGEKQRDDGVPECAAEGRG